jgi:hypothetical protein
MPKPITTVANKFNTIYWQQGDGDVTIGEPAILVEVYSDSISLEQEGNVIRLNFETLPDLAKHFNKIFREYKAGHP